MTALVICGIVFAALLFLWLIVAVLCFHLLFRAKGQTREDSLAILNDKGTPFADEIPDSALEQISVGGAGGVPLNGYYVNRFPDARKVVILVHGIRANHVIGLQYAPLFLAGGYNVLAIDQRAHGESGGRFSTFGYYESRDLAAWVCYLRKRLGADCEIGLMGHSMGAATVLCYPELDGAIRFIVADCAYDSLKNFMLHLLRGFYFMAGPMYATIRLLIRLRCGFDPEVVNPAHIATRQGCDIPVLFVHTKGDRAISYLSAQRMYDARGNPRDRLYIHENAKHPDVYADGKESYRRVVDEFLGNL
ncbi:MAG: alpha/beta hydrolase [Acetanaerobacterium sp.]